MNYDTAGLAVNTTLLVVNLFLLLAALNKYAHATRLLEDAKKLSLRALLLKRKV